jgi:hypothetical protein
MSHSPVLYCASFPNAALLAASRGRWNSGDFAFSGDTFGYYTYYEVPPPVPPPGSVPSIEGGVWVPFSSSGPPPPATTAYVEDLFNCTLATSVLDVVFVSAPGTVDRASASSLNDEAAIGIVSSKPTPTTAYVRYLGRLSGFAGLIPGKTYYVGNSPGTLLLTPVDAPGYVVQKVGVAVASDTLDVNVSPNTTVL